MECFKLDGVIKFWVSVYTKYQLRKEQMLTATRFADLEYTLSYLIYISEQLNCILYTYNFSLVSCFI
jgi:hypothetical protein